MSIKVTPQRVGFIELVKMLIDSKSWKIEETYGIKEIVHKDGFRYYPDGACVFLRNPELGIDQRAGVFEFIIVLPLAAMNTKRVMNRPTEKDVFGGA